MSIFAEFFKRRTGSEEVTFLDANGANSVLGLGDKVRVKVGRPGETPLLDIVSGTPLAGGSSVTAANPATLRIDEDDTGSIQSGIYEIEAVIYDATDGAIKHAESGVFVLQETQLGGVT